MIRDAMIADVSAIVDMAQMLVTESPTFDLAGFDRSKTRRLLESLLGQRDGILVVSEAEGVLNGAMAGYVTEQPFGYEKYAYDLGLFVVPDSRGRFVGKRLIRHFEGRARALGAKTFGPGVMTGVHVPRTTGLYERLGYQVIGTQLLKVL
jgi:ribosomal protein S18 acetylase RimI-like enzyme